MFEFRLRTFQFYFAWRLSQPCITPATKIPYAYLFFPLHATCSAYRIFFEFRHFDHLWWWVGIMNLHTVRNADVWISSPYLSVLFCLASAIFFLFRFRQRRPGFWSWDVNKKKTHVLYSLYIPTYFVTAARTMSPPHEKNSVPLVPLLAVGPTLPRLQPNI